MKYKIKNENLEVFLFLYYVQRESGRYTRIIEDFKNGNEKNSSDVYFIFYKIEYIKYKATKINKRFIK